MQRYLAIAGSAVAVLVVLALGAYFAFLNGGDQLALAQLDRLVRAYDGGYDDATFDVAEDLLVVDGLTLRNYAADADAEPLDLIEVGHLEVAGLSRFSLQDAISYGNGGQAFSQLIANDVALTEQGQTIRLARIILNDVALGGASVGGPGGGTRAQEFAAFLLNLTAGEIRVEGFESPAEGPTGMNLDLLRIEAIEEGEVGAIWANGIYLWDEGRIGTVGDTVRLRAESFSISGLDARTPLRRIAGGERIAFERQSDIPLYNGASTEGLIIEEEGSAPLSVGSITVQNEAYEGPMATQTTWALSSLRMPIDGAFVDQTETTLLRELGYEELVLSFRYESAFDLSGQEFTIQELSLSAADMGELRMDVEIGNVPFTAEMADMTADALLAEGFVTSLLEQAELRGGGLSVTDHGAFERAVNRNAALAGVSPEEYLATTIADLEAERREVTSSDLAVQTIDAILAFLNEPGSISVTIAPDEPVPVHQVFLVTQINPFLLVELLNLHVEAGPKDE